MANNKKRFPYFRHYSWIMAKWFGICLLIGFALAILGTGRGGASVVFVILAVYIGLLGGTLHSLVLAFRANKWRHMLPILIQGNCMKFFTL